MKKVSIITVLLMLASVPSVMWADEILLDNVNVEPKGTTPPPIITAPKWDEFCEPGYENAVYTDKNDVFNYIIADGVTQIEYGGLSNVAPTILKLMNLEIPKVMDKPLF